MSEEQNKSFSETILEEWSKDAIFDRHNAANESANIPKLHAKYLKYLKHVNSALVQLRKKKNVLYKEKGLYYSGKAEPEEYKKKPFGLKVMKTDLDPYIKADDDYNSVMAKIEECEMMIEGIKSILNMIKDRNWQIRNIIEWDKFTSGA